MSSVPNLQHYRGLPEPESAAQTDLFDGIQDPFGRFMPIKDVMVSVGLSKAMIYRLMKYEDNPFPEPVKVGTASFWLERDVIAWKTACVGES